MSCPAGFLLLYDAMHSAQPDFSSARAKRQWKIAIVRSLWHGDITKALASDAKMALIAAGMQAKNILMIDAPGSFEVPLLCREVILSSGVQGVIAFGIILQGDTHHARLLADTTAQGLMDLQLHTGVPITFEILYINDLADAKKRAVGPHAKGALAASTLLTTLAKIEEMR